MLNSSSKNHYIKKYVEESKVKMKTLKEEKRVKRKQYEELKRQEGELTHHCKIKMKKVERSMNASKKDLQ